MRDSAPPPPIEYSALLRWCKSNRQALRFQRGLDRLEISREGLALEVFGNRWLSVEPRLVFFSADGQPVLHAPALTPQLPDSGIDSLFLLAGSDRPVPWSQVANWAQQHSDFGLGICDLLVKWDLLSPGEIKAALAKAAGNESPDATLARLEVLPLANWVTALAGDCLIGGPQGRHFVDRIGMRLLHEGWVSQGMLKQALNAQGTAGRLVPLGELLGARGEPLQRALAKQQTMPMGFAEADELGEVLIRWGCVSRTQWLRAGLEGGDTAATLFRSGILSASAIARAKRYQALLTESQMARCIRLGQVLRAQGLDLRILGNLLACQVDQPLPLGELLVLHRAIGPATVAVALGEQAKKYRDEAEGLLAPLASPSSTVSQLRWRPRQLRRALLAVVFTIFLLSYALALGSRFHGADYGWLNAFFPPSPLARPKAAPDLADAGSTVGTVRTRPDAVGPIDPLAAPGEARTWSGSPPTFLASRLEGTASAWSAGWSATARQNQFAWQGGLPPGASDPGRDRSAPAAARVAGQARQPLRSLAASGSPGSGRFGQSPLVGSVAQVPSPTLDWQFALASSSSQPTAYRFGPQQPQAAKPRPTTPSDAFGGTGLAPKADRDLNPAWSIKRAQAIFRTRLGLAHFQEGKLAEAQAEFAGAAHDDPKFALPRYYLGAIAQKSGHAEAASAFFREYLRLAPDGDYASLARQALGLAQN